MGAPGVVPSETTLGVHSSYKSRAAPQHGHCGLHPSPVVFGLLHLARHVRDVLLRVLPQRGTVLGAGRAADGGPEQTQ